MQDKILVNTLIEWKSINDVVILERVLHINKVEKKVWLIRIPTTNSWPQELALERVLTAIEHDECSVLSNDPYIMTEPFGGISTSSRLRLERSWQSMSDLVTRGPEAMFLASERAAWIQRQVQSKQYSKPHLYKMLRRYWQGGQTPYALLPRFDRCGARGVTRQQSPEHKRGRRVKPWIETDRPPGINIDEETKRLLERGWKTFYEISPAPTLTEAYKDTLKKFFATGYELGAFGVLVPTLLPVGERPTFAQFTYWYKKSRREVLATKLRYGGKSFNAKSRAILGNSTARAYGPGSEYQIDSTILDVYLRSRINKNLIVGRAVLYIVKDTFSRMIVGFYVGFENPSWRSALMALENVTTDKVTFCSDLGITGVTKEVWPTSHMPASFIADRGEFEGYNADFLVQTMNISISTTPPYRADWKPFVERHFGLINTRVLEDLPGHVEKRARGRKDTRLDAAIDLPTLRQILALDFIGYNNTAVIAEYPLDADMVTDDVRACPIELWNWGIENRSGAQKQFPKEIVRRFLLPRKPAFVTAKGVRVGTLYFTAPILEQFEWFSRARIMGVNEVSVSYDPLSELGIVFMHISLSSFPELLPAMSEILNDVGLIRCEVIQHRGFEKGVSFVELEHEAQIKSERNEQKRQEVEPQTISWQTQADALLATNKEETRIAILDGGKRSKRSQISGIRTNRQTERDADRRVQDRENQGVKPQRLETPSNVSRYPSSLDDALNALMDTSLDNNNKEV